MVIDRIKKRNGIVVEFDRSRIERAMEKAFVATSVEISPETLRTLADRVIADLAEQFTERIPGVEDVQDLVEQKLADAGYFETSKAYIIYRREREKMREQKKLEAIKRVERSEITVKKRGGGIVRFDIKEIESAVVNCAKKYPDSAIDVEGIMEDCKTGIYDGITTSEINQVVLMAIRARIERDPVYARLGARFLFTDLAKEILKRDEFSEGFEKTYREGFAKSVKAGVECGRLDPRLLEFNLDQLANALVLERDGLFEYMGAQTLYDRYFLKNYEQDILEMPQYFWMRVAMGLGIGSSLFAPDKEKRAIEFYDAMSTFRYLPSTPTLLHSGTVHPQMSSCYLTTVEDDLHHIFKCIGDNAQLSKWSGGIGNDWSNIRAVGSTIKSINVTSQGVVPFLKIVDATTASINRSGKRRGATCVYLETWHYEVEDFLELKKNTGDERRRTHDINTAHWIPDLFMKRLAQNGLWTLFSPEEVPDLHHTYGRDFERRYEEYEAKALRGEIGLFKQVRAQDLWRKMITLLFETGHPWITFKDPSNIRSPQDHAGIVHSSNLCTEITLNTSKEETAVCNLGSVNLVRHIEHGTLNRELLAETVRTAMRMLDNVIDMNYYPTEEAKTSNLRHRPVGLGIMGYQDLLYALGMRFDSDEAVALSDELMEFVSYHSILASSELAKERGAYSTYEGSKWHRGLFPLDTLSMLEDERGIATGIPKTSRMDWMPVREHVKQYGMRNSNCMAIAPTATIANISGCLPSIEPIYKNLYVKSNFSGEFTIVNKYLVEDLKKIGLWNNGTLEKLKYYDGSIQRIYEIPEELRAKYKEVFEIDSLWIVKHAAHRGKWIDQSQSVNIFTTSESGRLISDVYMNAWRMGLKTTYYLRTLAASSIEKSTIDINKKFESPTIAAPAVSAGVEAQFAAAPAVTGPVTNAAVYIAEDGICESCQ